MFKLIMLILTFVLIKKEFAQQISWSGHPADYGPVFFYDTIYGVQYALPLSNLRIFSCNPATLFRVFYPPPSIMSFLFKLIDLTSPLWISLLTVLRHDVLFNLPIIDVKFLLTKCENYLIANLSLNVLIVESNMN